MIAIILIVMWWLRKRGIINGFVSGDSNGGVKFAADDDVSLDLIKRAHEENVRFINYMKRTYYMYNETKDLVNNYHPRTIIARSSGIASISSDGNTIVYVTKAINGKPLKLLYIVTYQSLPILQSLITHGNHWKKEADYGEYVSGFLRGAASNGGFFNYAMSG